MDKRVRLLFGLLTICLIYQATQAQTAMLENNYKIFDARGKASTFEQIVSSLEEVDVVFLGENHDDAIAHQLQAKIFEAAVGQYGDRRSMLLSLEMFERDVQTVIDEYLQGLITEKKFLDDSRPWRNYQTDYRPLVELAKSRKIPVVAANAPRRYVNMVSRGGRETLSKLTPLAKSWLAPLPYAEASEAYSKKFKSLMGESAEAMMGLNNILSSQSLWDATMADSISKAIDGKKAPLIVHLNGAFHTENRLGTVEHLLKYQPKVKVLVVTMRYEDDYQNFNPQKHGNLGDFVILTNSKVPRSSK